jgi:hypothetical protein
MSEIVRFVKTALVDDGGNFRPKVHGVYVATSTGSKEPIRFTTERDSSIQAESRDLVGLGNPLVLSYLQRYRELLYDQIGRVVKSDDGRLGILAIWHIATQGDRGEFKTHLLTLAVDGDGQRLPHWEKQAERLFHLLPASQTEEPKRSRLTATIEPMIQREHVHKGLLREHLGYEARLVRCIQIA